jgi:hypothetical protein
MSYLSATMSTACTFSEGQSNIDNFHFKIKLLILLRLPSPITHHPRFLDTPFIAPPLFSLTAIY